MRLLITFTLTILVFCIQAQDTIYFNNVGKRVTSSDRAHSFEVRVADPDNPDCVSIKEFNSNGLPISYVEYKSEKDRIIHGSSELWYENGQLKRKMKYSEGKLHGELLTYWPDGTLRRKDLFNNGLTVTGKIWDRVGKEMEHFDFRIEPEFPGGVENLFVLVGQNLKYPRRARRKSIEGIVVVGFKVEKDGRVNEAIIHTSLNRALDREALRVVNLIPPFIPGQIEGEPERFQFFFPIRFKLN